MKHPPQVRSSPAGWEPRGGEGGMRGENDLSVLLRSMEPLLDPVEMGYGHLPPGQALPPGLAPFAVIAEAEGLTVVASAVELARHGVAHDPGWARISLTVHSDLAAVGLTAALATALAAEGISANVVAGYFHDHLFVQWDRRFDAMTALARLGAA